MEFIERMVNITNPLCGINILFFLNKILGLAPFSGKTKGDKWYIAISHLGLIQTFLELCLCCGTFIWLIAVYEVPNFSSEIIKVDTIIRTVGRLSCLAQTIVGLIFTVTKIRRTLPNICDIINKLESDLTSKPEHSCTLIVLILYVGASLSISLHVATLIEAFGYAPLLKYQTYQIILTISQIFNDIILLQSMYIMLIIYHYLKRMNSSILLLMESRADRETSQNISPLILFINRETGAEELDKHVRRLRRVYHGVYEILEGLNSSFGTVFLFDTLVSLLRLTMYAFLLAVSKCK